MADVKKIATRESYGNTLKELAAEGHEDLVVLDADLAAATKTGMFRKAYLRGRRAALSAAQPLCCCQA